ncbi:MAG TPA: 2-amino-4-oxopentanoate thiolase subunit OrtA [Bacillota bacterium]|nr:2-amino-4-oxopentanoate thiolase subunit OrtA [Bacillota bacterium]HQB80638.1 2-amino-4-oxopentanoate thiolase subunit OrtA [Bacillota bacterium]
MDRDRKTHFKQGDYAVIQEVVLPVGQRAPQVPEDTAKTPLIAFTKGWIQEDEARAGERVHVKTMSGRTVEGTLTSRDLAPSHDYGDYVPELLVVHRQVRNILFGGDAE